MQVCLFDIDGTLISSGGAGKAALEAGLIEEFGIDRITDELELGGRTDRAICRDLFRYHVLDDTPENWRRLIAAYLRHLPACLTANLSDMMKLPMNRLPVAKKELTLAPVVLLWQRG